MLNNLNGWHLLIVLAIVLLLFGAPRLPGLARSVGQSLKIFRSETASAAKGEQGAAAEPADATGGRERD